MSSFNRRKFLKISAAVSGGACLAALAGTSIFSRKTGARPNIVLLNVDTLRADHCSCYGYDRKTTPFLDKLASGGTMFRQCIASSSWTTPSIMTMFTGLSPLQHEVTSPLAVLPENIPTIASELKKAGYYTVGVVCNPCAAGKMGFANGFNVYDDFSIVLDYEMNIFDVSGGKRRDMWRTFTGSDITELALRHVRNIPENKPWFLYVLYFDPHSDYTPPAEYAKMFDTGYEGTAAGNVNDLPNNYVFDNARDLEHVVSLYDAEIRADDKQIQTLLGALRGEDLLSENDMIICTSDHGEEFNEHGGLQHRKTLYEEVVRVPLVIRWPGHVPAGHIIEDMVSHEDIFPSLLRSINTDVPAGLSETDIFSLASGAPVKQRKQTGLHLRYQDIHLEGIRTAEAAVICDRKSGRAELFDMNRDPKQMTALPADGPLSVRLDEWSREQTELARKRNGASPVQTADVSKEQMKILRSLGYVH